MSKATQMAEELLVLAKGTIPKTRLWQTEIHLGRSAGQLPDSRNKFLVCNAAELLFAWLENNRARVRDILDWWVWFAGTGFTAGEDLTPEEVYRTMQAYAAEAAAAVARKTGHPGYSAILALSKAHAAWLLIGAGCGPARKVRDHHLDKIGKPVVLVGDGAPVSALPYIAQAGKRGWIRNREDGPQTFLFCEATGLSAIVGQAAGLPVPRKLTPWQVDLHAALLDFAPGLPPFGFESVDQVVAQAFLANPADPTPVREVVKWVAPHPPELPFTFVRYVDGSIVSLCERAGGSSTDTRMIDAWFADGRSMKTSADDGLRSSSPPQIGFELGESFACEFTSGGPAMTVPRPRAAEAWRVRSANGTVTLTVPGVTAPAPTGPAQPGNPAPSPAPRPSGRRRKGGCALILFASAAALAWVLA